ncbi:MAG: methylated-DNA-[protein]-cysteine S-methyltransferase [Patescibacteria group bacterium]|jgi:O-6-methylguanine DNA methyltransferase|nr:methylated-DNA-[protein]-cysteine S-methyltransferase [Patescibacteria group bacterium]
MEFKSKVLDVVRNIPKGQTMTYGEVAALAGSDGAARAVGNIMKQNYDPTVPCHRVVRSDGTAGGYNRGEQNKISILQSEGAIK